MDILAWNYRGIGNDVAVEALKVLIRENKPSVIFMSETKISNPSQMDKLRREIGYLNCEAVYSVNQEDHDVPGQSGGVALFWRDEVRLDFQSKSAHHIDVIVRELAGGVRWRLTGFYGHPTTSERHKTWDLLRDLGDVSSLPWMVIGDFNELLHKDEKDGGPLRREGQLQLFRDCLHYCELYDLGFIGEQFTWRRGDTRSRLDRAVTSRAWFGLFPHDKLRHLSHVHGDHVPILREVFVSRVLSSQRKKRRFRFEAFWTNYEDCEDMVRKGWRRSRVATPMHEVAQCIQNTRFVLNDWQKIKFGIRGREIAAIRSRIRVLNSLPLTSEHVAEYSTITGRLDSLLADENKYWGQRAKVLWMTEGEGNTKFFHRKCSNRKVKNRISGLYNDEGVMLTSSEGIEGVVIDYFSSMFKANEVDPVKMTKVINLIEPKVTAEMNEQLLVPYSEAEVKHALFQMHPSKSPGSDGMPPLFFQRYWDVIGKEVVEATINFLDTGILLGQVNFTHVCLIPKVSKPERMMDLRPIYLCNVIYKIASKVIVNRHKKILDQIISSFQIDLDD